MVVVSDCVAHSVSERAPLDAVEAVWPLLTALRDRSPSIVFRCSALASGTDVV